MVSKKLYFLMAIVLFSYGCSASRGSMTQSTGTGVSLKENNYKVVKAGAKGESSGFYFLGFIPIVSPTYADAKESLYKSVDQNLEGRSVALANQTEDRAWRYFLLFALPKLTITADIVEFNKESSTKQ